jgi:hypothetical protein
LESLLATSKKWASNDSPSGSESPAFQQPQHRPTPPRTTPRAFPRPEKRYRRRILPSQPSKNRRPTPLHQTRQTSTAQILLLRNLLNNLLHPLPHSPNARLCKRKPLHHYLWLNSLNHILVRNFKSLASETILANHRSKH